MTGQFDWVEFNRWKQGKSFPSTRQDRIRKLRRITVERGATPAEARAAVERVRDLQRRYRRYGERLRKACRDVDECISVGRSSLVTRDDLEKNETLLQERLRTLIEEASKLVSSGNKQKE